jgi:hypothetical protein
VSDDVQVDNLESLLRDPLNADFTAIAGLEKVKGGSKPETGGLDSDDLGTDDAAAKSTASDQDDKTTGTPSAAGATDTAPPAKEEGTPAETPDAVIQARDGKNVIPFAVLQAERERARKLESQLADLNAKLANVQHANETGTTDSTPAVDEIISPDELAALKADAPELGKVFEKLVGKIKTLETTATQVQQREQDDIRTRVQEAIDANPKLAYLQATDPEKWAVVTAIDDWAMQQPQFQSLSLSDRFAKSLAMYEAAHGVVQLPASASGKETTTTDAQAKADAAIAKAMQGAAPNTLTDIPGGNPPPKNDLEAAESMSAAMLTEQFMHMDKGSMDKFLAKFG